MASEIPSFLKSVLDKAIVKHISSTSYQLDIQPGFASDAGRSSDLISIIVTTPNKPNTTSEQLNLICKHERGEIDRLRDFMTVVCFNREINFYKNIAPLLLEFQSGKALNDTDSFQCICKCYAAENDEFDHFAIILDDLRSNGFVMWNSKQPIRNDHSTAVMRALGKFHGISLAMKHQKPNLFEQFTNADNIPKEFLSGDYLQALLHPVYDQAIELLKDEEHKNVLRSVKKQMAVLFEQCLGKIASRRFGVITHGDFWSNNILYRYEKNVVKEVRFIDFQVNGYASPAIDLLYFIFSATNKELRAENYENMLQTYYESLSDIVRALGSNPDQLFTYADLKDELQKCGAFTFLTVPMLLKVSLFNSEEDELTSPAYEERLNDVVADLIKLNYHSNIL